MSSPSGTRRSLAVLVSCVTALFAALVALASASDAAPCAYSNCVTLSVSTTTPPVGGTITISGTGWGANDTVNITLHTATYPLASPTADASGAFTTTVTLPAGVSGRHTIVAVDPTTGQTASVAITIGAPSAAPGAAPGGGGLSNTGVAVISIGALGVVLLVGGGLMLLAGRRRRVSA